MDSIDSLKKHLISAQNLKKIVSTMKALAGTNIKKYEKVSLNLIKYMNNIQLGLQGILKQNKEIINAVNLVEQDIDNYEKKQTIMFVVGSNQGLCGRFNDRIVEFFSKDTEDIDFTSENYKVISIGDKINSLLDYAKIPIFKHISLSSSIENVINIIYEIISFLEEMSQSLSYQNVFIYFTAYDQKSHGVLTKKKIIPLEKKVFEKMSKKKWPTNNVPAWRVDTKTLFVDFIKQYMFMNVYYSIASSMTAEQKSRLMTLQGAEDNINENIAQTTLQYNQTRQTIVTSELLDVVSGYKSLKRRRK